MAEWFGILHGRHLHQNAQGLRSAPSRTIRKPGIEFRDITTLLGDAWAFRRAVDELVQPWAGAKIDKVAGIEARGFILGGAVAHQLSAGFVPVRKKGKLPGETVRIAYSLEYGLDEMEVHRDAVRPGERVILVDDLVATGGTAAAAVELLRKIGAEVVAAVFVIDLARSRRRRQDPRARRAGADTCWPSRGIRVRPEGGPAARPVARRRFDHPAGPSASPADRGPKLLHPLP